MTYRYILITAKPESLDKVLDANSEYNAGLIRERALAHSAPDLLATLRDLLKAYDLMAARVPVEARREIDAQLLQIGYTTLTPALEAQRQLSRFNAL